MRTASRAGALAALTLSTLCLPQWAHAGASDYVITPIVEEGEREIDFKAGNARRRGGTNESKMSLGVGWGATSWWFTELYAIFHKEPGERRSFDAWEWENKFQLTPTGKYPLDVGFLLEIERSKDRAEGYELRWGPLLQTEIGAQLQANLNLLLEKHVHVTGGGKAELGYQWQMKYRWRRQLEWGVQGFGDVGPWDHWEPASQQPHIAGPAIFGRFKAGDRQVVKYNAGLLFGLTDGAPRRTARLQAEYEF